MVYMQCLFSSFWPCPVTKVLNCRNGSTKVVIAHPRKQEFTKMCSCGPCIISADTDDTRISSKLDGRKSFFGSVVGFKFLHGNNIYFPVGNKDTFELQTNNS